MNRQEDIEILRAGIIANIDHRWVDCNVGAESDCECCLALAALARIETSAYEKGTEDADAH
jgi:hypothetical protein